MRLSLFSLGMVLALTLIATGCGQEAKNSTNPNTIPPGPGTAEPSQSETAPQSNEATLHPSQETVRQFLSAMVRENTRDAFALFTPKAREEYQKTGSTLDPKVFQGMTFRITGGDEMPDAGIGFYAVYVDMVNEGELIDAVWGVRKIGDDYRIANLMMSFDGDVMALNFEDPAGTLNAFAGDFEEQQGPGNQVQMNHQQVMSQNPQVLQQQFTQPPQFEGFQQQNPPQMAQPHTPNFQ